MLSIPVITAFRSRTSGWSSCRRLKASSCRVKAAARSAAPWISSDVGPAHVVVRQVRQQKLGLRPNDGQHVVEVVSDAAGQPADRFHLVGLAELILQLLALGDVGRHASTWRALPSGESSGTFTV